VGLIGKAVELTFKFVNARINPGKVEVALKQDEAALKAFLAASSPAPQGNFALKNIGLIYAQNEKFDLAAPRAL
jgi:hypothetical protein